MRKFSIAKHALAFITALLCGLSINASVEVNGIYYQIRDNKYAYVTYQPDGVKYSGDLVIPDSITVDSVRIAVMGLRDNVILRNSPDLTSLEMNCYCRSENSTNPECSIDLSNCTSLKTVKFGLTNRRPSRYLPDYFKTLFSNCSSLEKVTYPEEAKEYTGNIKFVREAFLNCNKLTALENMPTDSKEITVSRKSFYKCESFDATKYIDLSKVVFDKTYSDISASFQYCKITKLEIPETMTEIPPYTFGSNPLTDVTLPSTLTSIGEFAFYSYDYPVERFTANEGLIHLGEHPFYGIKYLHIPSTLTSLEDPGFLNEITVAEGNKDFFVKNNALYQDTHDGNITFRRVFGENAHNTEFVWNETDERVTTIGESAFEYSAITDYNFPYVKAIGYSAFRMTHLRKATIKAGVKYGNLVFAFSDSLKEVSIEEGVEILRGYSLRGCNALKQLTLPSTLNRLDWTALPASIERIECKSEIVPTVIEPSASDTIFGSNELNLTARNVTLVVPKGCAERYRNNKVWSQCKEIIENEEWEVAHNAAQQLPTGLYFATKNGNIRYYSDGSIHDTGIPSGDHPFQMQNYGNAVYVADAGEIFTYTTNSAGDGLFYKIEYDGNRFFKTPIMTPMYTEDGGNYTFSLHNYDPYTCFIDKSKGDIYITNRSVGATRINANERDWRSEGAINTASLSKTFVQTNWLEYYSRGLAYGAQPTGFHRDNNGLNWMSYFYNGFGIYRFNDNDIHPEGYSESGTRPYSIILYDEYINGFYIDEANGYLYVLVFEGYGGKHTGLYRIALDEVDNYTSDLSSAVCITDEPASIEGTTTEPGIRQITGDGKNIYWSYIAPKGEGYVSGIKMVNATGTPIVKTLIEGIEAYGLTLVDGDQSSASDITAAAATSPISVTRDGITANDDIAITIYSASGAAEAHARVAAGETFATNSLGTGIHIVVATDTNGNSSATKIVVK